jgi:anti-anti-sigma factor
VSEHPIRPAQTFAPLGLEFERPDDGALRVIASGEIDFSSASSMQARIIAACERETTSELILDLSSVDFIDSSGLGVIMRLQRELAEQDGALVLLDPTAPVRRSIALMGLDSHLLLADDRPQAEALLAQRPR